mmetsp:Transcript_64003/g.180178  ORF Transcript_64003/g.180178 Transcript_64003/m.180178 type:complete len:208 (-) Transcript_64003:54-677(-)
MRAFPRALPRLLAVLALLPDAARCVRDEDKDNTTRSRGDKPCKGDFVLDCEGKAEDAFTTRQGTGWDGQKYDFYYQCDQLDNTFPVSCTVQVSYCCFANWQREFKEIPARIAYPAPNFLGYKQFSAGDEGCKACRALAANADSKEVYVDVVALHPLGSGEKDIIDQTLGWSGNRPTCHRTQTDPRPIYAASKEGRALTECPLPPSGK